MPRPNRLSVFIIVIGWVQFYTLLGSITYLSLTPDPGDAFEVVSDKLLHIVGWMGLCLSLWLAWRRLRYFWLLAIALFGYSILIDVLQQFTGRQYSLADIVANAGGVALGYGIAWLLNPVLQRHLSQLIAPSQSAP